MLFLVAAALAAPAQQVPMHSPVAATAQAQATIRILSGAAVHFGESGVVGEGVQRTTTIQTNGIAQTAKLIEFQ